MSSSSLSHSNTTLHCLTVSHCSGDTCDSHTSTVIKTHQSELKIRLLAPSQPGNPRLHIRTLWKLQIAPLKIKLSYNKTAFRGKLDYFLSSKILYKGNDLCKEQPHRRNEQGCRGRGTCKQAPFCSRFDTWYNKSHIHVHPHTDTPDAQGAPRLQGLTRGHPDRIDGD